MGTSKESLAAGEMSDIYDTPAVVSVARGTGTVTVLTAKARVIADDLWAEAGAAPAEAAEGEEPVEGLAVENTPDTVVVRVKAGDDVPEGKFVTVRIEH